MPTDQNMALEIAKLVKSLPLERGVKLIEQFGNSRAAEGRCEHATKVYEQQLAIVSKEMSNA